MILFEDDSALESAEVAKEVVRRALLPADQKKMTGLSVTEFVDQAYCSALRHLHEVDILIATTANYQKRAKERKERAEAAEKRLHEAKERAATAEARLESELSRVRMVESELIRA